MAPRGFIAGGRARPTHWAERRGVNPQAVLDFIHGKQAITSLRHFMPGESEAEIQREFELLEQAEAQDTDGVRALPGAIVLLERLNALGIPWAIVTSGSVPVAGARRRAGGLPQPEVFITAEQVKHGKPQPDAYLLGAERPGLRRTSAWWLKTRRPAFSPARRRAAGDCGQRAGGCAEAGSGRPAAGFAGADRRR